MRYEPLRDKKQKIKKEGCPGKQKNSENKFYLGFVKGVDESFEVFATYVEYYKEYKNDVKLKNKQIFQKKIILKYITIGFLITLFPIFPVMILFFR
jgi:hypothetical protein